MKYWLLKTEPTTYSIQDLKREKKTLWHGVRNYQARNFLRSMQIGDIAFIYHSNADPTGIAGTAQVVDLAEPDPTQFDSKSEYFDPKSPVSNPRWWCPRVKFISATKEIVTLKKLRDIPGLAKMVILQKGNRLSVTSVSDEEYSILYRLIEG